MRKKEVCLTRAYYDMKHPWHSFYGRKKRSRNKRASDFNNLSHSTVRHIPFFTPRLTSLIFRQFKTGFKVELKNNIPWDIKVRGKGISISRNANGANTKYGIK